MSEKLFIALTKFTGLAFLLIPAATLPLWIEGQSSLVAALSFGIWSYGIGYIDRGWTDYLKSIGKW